MSMPLRQYEASVFLHAEAVADLKPARAKVQLWRREFAAIVTCPEPLVLAPQHEYGPSDTHAVPCECVT